MGDKALEGLALLAGRLVGAARAIEQNLRVLSIGGGRMTLILGSHGEGLDDTAAHEVKWLGRREVAGVRVNLVLLDGTTTMPADPELVVKAMQPMDRPRPRESV